MRGENAFVALQRAADRTVPACRGDRRFTADELGVVDRDLLARICRGCPLLALCAAYAHAGRPEGGFWAGRVFAGQVAA